MTARRPDFQGSAPPAATTLLSAIATLALIAPATTFAQTEWHLQTGGLSKHFAQTEAPDREWNQTHPGLGLEYRVEQDSYWATRWTAGLMKDSREFVSGYAGVAYLYDFNRRADFNTSIGLGAFGFYRSSSWEGDGAKTLVPALVPILSFGLFENRVGVSVLAVPEVAIFGRKSTPLVFAQFSVKFD